MDYIPVFDGDDSDDGSVKLSPGKIQRTGVKSEPATRRVIRTQIRAPGTIQLDERRISVISMRAESWVQKVADVTTGTKVRSGQPLMDIYSPAISSAAAEYVATDHVEDDGRRWTVWARVASTDHESRRSGHGDLPKSRRVASSRSPSRGPPRGTASFLSATPSKGCGRNPATSSFVSPTRRSSGQWSMSRSAILEPSPSDSR